MTEKLSAYWQGWLSRLDRLDSNRAPLRAELFSTEQLRHHAQTLARHDEVLTTSGSNSLPSRLNNNERILRGFNRATSLADQSRRITPAAEWLVDNFYLIDEQIQMVRRHLPHRYNRELPRLRKGLGTGLPRVYNLAIELISHVDAQIDSAQLTAFVAAYQTIVPLKLGELWAMPIMLRLGLIENLRRITVRLSTARHHRDVADTWADRLKEVAGANPSRLIVVVAEMAESDLPSSSAFISQLCQRLSKLNPAVHFARQWLDQHLAEQGLSVEQLVLTESQSQAADQVSVSHSIASLRFLGAMNWREFVEALSVVDQTLRDDPAGIYGNMDFGTRDRYRHQIEQISRYSNLSEIDVARTAIGLATRIADQTVNPGRAKHVGYYLVDKGRHVLEVNTGVRWPWHIRVEKAIRRFPLPHYLGGVLLITLAATLATAAYAHAAGMAGWKMLVVTSLFSVCSSQLAVAFINWWSQLLLKPSLLPRLDFSNGIAAGCRTIVVVPTMLTGPAVIDRLLETVEIHYLANRDKQLHFALLTDFCDAATQFKPSDPALIRRARAGIEGLNRKYLADRPNIFYLFHRPREWNETQGVWMGFERKRGKLTEFNALLRNRGQERFSEIVGDVALLSDVKYVITLDTDTQLPRDVARQLVGAIAHPLNQPAIDPETGIVTEGYGILQPRVGISLPSSDRSWFVRIFGGDAGIDPYTRTVSDVYQDLFNEGSFIGKGIYDVDAFEQALQGRFPENRILSHDLIESVHARSGLISDVELYEEYPSKYNADINRRHRWIRGDWQVAQWLLPRVPGADVRRVSNPLSGVSRWKLFDNLRRSLVPAALVLTLLSDWICFPELNGVGVLFVLAVIMIPGALTVLTETFRKAEEWPLLMHLRFVARSLGHQLGQIALTLVFLPYDAYVSLDAIVRTSVRLLFTRKRLLEWQTASDAECHARTDAISFYQTMWVAPGLALTAFIGLAIAQPWRLAGAVPLLTIWLCAPWIAWWISRPIEREPSTLTAGQLDFLGQIARKTWRFFETFVTAQENWLPPDNLQEHPTPVIASRTSPTNIGLALLANLAACDFGYLSVGELITRTQKTVGTLLKLERHRGHFLNWYDTRTLTPLPPQYVSTVDSGNLAGHLLTLGAGLLEYPDQPIFDCRVFAGLRDTLLNVKESGGDHPLIEKIDTALKERPACLQAGFDLLQEIARHGSSLATAWSTSNDEAKWWSRVIEQTCQNHLHDLAVVAPWLTLSAERRQAAQRVLQQAGSKESGEPGVSLEPLRPAGISLREAISRLGQNPTLRDLAGADRLLVEFLSANVRERDCQELVFHLRDGSQRALERIQAIEVLARQVNELAEMDFGFLFDPARDLFAIGYNVTERRRDSSFYDLLASEARLASFVAIAEGKVAQAHWFSLGRLLAAPGGEPVLVSWSGSIFEYLMPLLVMPSYENTLLDRTCKAAVRAQIEYGRVRGVPWGISESGYNSTDVQLNYQYRAFGVPGLGFKRGLADDLVIAPYATVMALMVAPQDAYKNLERLAADDCLGPYGFREAVDYTPSRLPPNEPFAIVRSFMAHHQGMSLLALASVLRERPMQRRFLSYPPFKATELLLQEKVPKAIAGISTDDLDSGELPKSNNETRPALRIFVTPNTATPEAHLLSNGRYHVVITAAGGGYSRWQDLAVTRWREDPTRDCWGRFCYLRDVASGEFWSAAYQPALRSANRYEAIFTQARAEFRQQRDNLDVHSEISVSPEDDVELMRITLANHSSLTRTIEFTSYSEIVLTSAAADAAHPAFSNLFVQTEWVQSPPAILCNRRARSDAEHPPWLFHLMTIQGDEQGRISWETDRARFIGRGATLAEPAALQSHSSLSNTTGSVLDPIVSIRRTVRIPPDGTGRIEILTGVAESRAAAKALVEKYHGPRMTDRIFELAWTHSQVTLRHLDATESDAQLYGRMAGSLIFADPSHRAGINALLSNRRGQTGLWSYGISGDSPIVLLRIGDSGKMDFVRRMVQAHAYWRMKGLAVELMILNEDTSVYRQDLQDQIVSTIASGVEAHMLDKPGGIFVRRVEQVSPEDRILMQAAARMVLSDEDGALEDGFPKPRAADLPMPHLKTTRKPGKERPLPSPPRDLILFNGLGGFTRDGREYIITLNSAESRPVSKSNSLQHRNRFWSGDRRNSAEQRSWVHDERRIDLRSDMFHSGVNKDKSTEFGFSGHVTPAPWVNVLSNPFFGTVVSESGSAYTWLENSHEYRLTPWGNDPVTDASGEAFYLRDDETGEFWSPSPLPARGIAPYVIRHGFGYTVFEHTNNGIASEMSVYVAMDAPVKFVSIKLTNRSIRPRRLAVTGYWEWVLGDLRSRTALHVTTELDSKSGAVLARNYYHTEFADYVAFVDITDPGRTVTGDRKEFLGRNGTLAHPEALKRVRLSGKTGAGLDPCTGMQTTFDLAPGENREITFRIGAGRSLQEVQYLIQRFRRAKAHHTALEGVWKFWNETLGAVHLETPDPAVNVMANGWLVYQTLSCRMWGRTGFYQSGGAFGFRDQLQDAMSLVHAEPGLLREHLLRAAAHQFVEGDVQHWWHPPSGRGVRTHISDDYLWLPYATCHYVDCLKDTGVLDEQIAFLEARSLKTEEESLYDLPHRSRESGSLYEHCVRAIEHGLKFGEHGLPLIGSGDWNDGLNLVGSQGRGESVWLGFFMFDVLTKFADLARRHNDVAFAYRCLTQAGQLEKNIELHGWDGQWYRRAYFDNGEPLGSRANTECQIDSLPQSWSVLSGAGTPERAAQAMNAVMNRLVRRDVGLIQLFDPPFDNSLPNPGYVKAYVPGIRENGGQYTHGAIWTVKAFAELGEPDLAWELFALLNPVNHASTPRQMALYKVEPYVVAGDVYSVEPHAGRGGWTWYTGSSGWMYQLLTETLLGLKLEGNTLRIQPRLPKGWPGFKLHYRYRETRYHITVITSEKEVIKGNPNPSDNQAHAEILDLVDDRQDHRIEVRLTTSPRPIGQSESSGRVSPKTEAAKQS